MYEIEQRPILTHATASTRSFTSVEQLDELPRELGWPLEYRQIEPGTFASTFKDLAGDDWFLMEEQSSRSVEVVGGAPSGMVMMALVEGAPVAVNGQHLRSDHIFLQLPDSDFRATLPAGLTCTQIGVRGELFADAINTVAPELSLPRESASVIAAAPGQLARIRAAMRATLCAPGNGQAAPEEAISRILADLIVVAFERGETRPAGRLHRPTARLALDRARAYIETHVGEPIRVESMCRSSGTSLRSLERIFDRELGVSPQQYVLARRLNAARRHFLEAGEDRPLRVTDVAHTFGFTHLGRFAGEYRRYFGESPRETLQRR